jgi:hypothetical protein
MKSQKVPSPKDIKAAAQAAADTAQAVATGAMRIAPWSVEGIELDPPRAPRKP